MSHRQASFTIRVCTLLVALALLAAVCGAALADASRAGSQPHMAYLPVAARAHFFPGPAPVLLSPADGTHLQTLAPQLEYDSGSDPLAVSSEAQVAVDQGFEAIIVDGLVNPPRGRVNCSVWFNLEPSTTYYWRAWLNYPDSRGSYSEVRSFTTGSGGAIPAAPQPIDPPNASRVWPGQVMLEWSAVPGAASYELSWGRSSMQFFENSLSVGSTSARVSAGPGTPYQWRVRARSTYAWGDWSQTWTFTTANVGFNQPYITP